NQTVRLDNGRNGPSSALCVSNPELIPEYTGELSVELNDNIPSFNEYDLTYVQGESYSDLDFLGRCGTAVAMIDRNLMPTEERGDIGMIRPTGWHQEKYPGIIDSDPPYLYNRCHLIAYALTGENANEKNLITGTRYFNAEGMLPYEKKVLRYLDDQDGKVLYRVTPYFSEDDLLARGVEMEAYSVDHGGRDVCFHVFVYNVQPGIIIDYHTGENKAA
nr:DNA/RNA non-specific endonuclease [Lachnospiraceae bacterium]